MNKCKGLPLDCFYRVQLIAIKEALETVDLAWVWGRNNNSEKKHRKMKVRLMQMRSLKKSIEDTGKHSGKQ